MAGPIDDLLADHVGAETGLLQPARAARGVVIAVVIMVVAERFDEAGARIVPKKHGLGAGSVLLVLGCVADDGDGLGAGFLGLGRGGEVGSSAIHGR